MHHDGYRAIYVFYQPTKFMQIMIFEYIYIYIYTRITERNIFTYTRPFLGTVLYNIIFIANLYSISFFILIFYNISTEFT